jgi:3-deoxy-manno-octulosonate cytidylyltransferase (CMP-KDO synthetase)
LFPAGTALEGCECADEVSGLTTGDSPQAVAIIPARYASERFPGKVIVPLAGKPLVAHTYERAGRAKLVSHAVVATDDQRVVNALKPFGVNTVMTRTDHQTGTDRIAEVAAGLDAEIIVNVQGDEPLVDPELIDATIQPLLDDPGVDMATARVAIDDLALIHDPNCVKVVCDCRGHALYFSRSTVPYVRDRRIDTRGKEIYWQHIGLYVFRRAFLLAFTNLPQTPLERLEKLEQLRALEHGYTIAVVDAHEMSIGVDTPEGFARAEAILAAGHAK